MHCLLCIAENIYCVLQSYLLCIAEMFIGYCKIVYWVRVLYDSLLEEDLLAKYCRCSFILDFLLENRFAEWQLKLSLSELYVHYYRSESSGSRSTKHLPIWVSTTSSTSPLGS